MAVDWGPDFALRHGAVERGEAALHAGFGPLGLGFVLAEGGSGYFRLGAVRPHLESGRLALVAGAPEFPYPAYAVHSATTSDGALIRAALDEMRAAARDDCARVPLGPSGPDMPASSRTAKQRR